MTAERRRDALRFGLRPPLRAPLRRCYTTPGDTTRGCSRSATLASGWKRAQVQTARWRLFQTTGKIVRHGRRVYLKINAAMPGTFSAIRERCALVVQEQAVPENVVIVWRVHFRDPSCQRNR